MTSSTSRDAAIRQAEREGGGLLARYRAGLLEVAYPCAPDVACPDGEFCTAIRPPLSGGPRRGGYPCTGCAPSGGAGSGRVPADPEDLPRLLAFCGVEEARALAGVATNPAGTLKDRQSVPVFVAWLSRLCAKLPARRVEVECREGKRHNHGICEPCNGTGKAHQDVPAERWLLVAACVAVGRECCAALKCSRESNTCFCTGLSEYEDCPVILAGQALDAAEAWVAEPTPEREAEWSVAVQTEARWAPGTHDERAANLQAAAAILGETRVRELVCAEVVRRVLG